MGPGEVVLICTVSYSGSSEVGVCGRESELLLLMVEVEDEGTHSGAR